MMPSVHQAVRGLWRSPGYAAISVVSLAVGIGGATAVFTAVDGLLLRPLAVERPEQLVLVQTATPDGVGSGSLPYPFYQALAEIQRRSPTETGLSHVLARMSAPVALAWDDGAMRAGVEFVSPDAFAMLGTVPALGRVIDLDPVAGATVISHRLWRTRFGGDPGVVGRQISVGGLPFVITAVAPATFTGLRVGLEIDVWLPLETFPDVFHQSAGIIQVEIMARLARDVSAAQAQARLGTVFERWQASSPPPDGDRERGTIALRPGGRGFGSTLRDELRPAMGLLLAACACLWLIATINTAGLGLVRVGRRRREIGIRLALGAGRAGLTMQFLAETLVLALLGGAAGWLLATQVTRLLPAFGSTWSAVNLAPSLNVLGLTLSVSVAAALIITWIQMAGLRRRSVVALLARDRRSSPRSGRRTWPVDRHPAGGAGGAAAGWRAPVRRDAAEPARRRRRLRERATLAGGA